MGMLDGLLSQVTSSLSGDAGQRTGLVDSALNMLTSGGGLQGLIDTMKEKGLGGVAASWVGTGANQAITPDQIQQVLGNEKLQQLAAEHGININEIASHLSQILPVAVDKLTPDGSIPAAGGLGGMLQGLLGGANP